MAKAVVSLARWRADHPYRDERGLERSILAALREALADAGRPQLRVRQRRAARVRSH
jgi:hypothetical protein